MSITNRREFGLAELYSLSTPADVETTYQMKKN